MTRRSALGTIVASALAVGLAGGGGYLVYDGLKVKEQDAPLPEVQVNDPEAPESGPDGKKPVKVSDTDEAASESGSDWEDEDGRGGRAIGEMSMPTMRNMSVFIPSIGAYSRVRATEDFTSSRYEGFYGIKVPNNPKRSVWFAGGAPMAGGKEGTTLIAGHVAKRHVWGAFRRLYRLKTGRVIWTKDDKGQYQKWLVTRIFYRAHTNFPQEFWKKDGPRQLVIATCGGRAHRGWYSDNVFAVARPVPS